MMSRSLRIFVVGLGPGSPSLRTLGAQRALDAASAIILRTNVHPGISDLVDDPRVTSCDDLYQAFEKFDSLYEAIAQRVISTARQIGDVVYAVPGHPRVAERTVPMLEQMAQEAGIDVQVLDGVSFVDVAVNAVAVDPIAAGLQMVDAEELAHQVERDPYGTGTLAIDPTRPLLVGQVYDAQRAAAVKLTLSQIYPDDHLVRVLASLAISGEATIRDVPLAHLDRQSPDHLTSVWVPPLDPMADVRTPNAPARLVARLRAPGGCPWDREQTHESLRNSVLAEAYEVVDAIDAADDEALAEELGDLLLLVLMHAQIAEEAGSFGIADVHEALSRKLIRRHPHVFGAADARTPDEVISTWEGVKAAERQAKGTSASSDDRLSRLPRSMPPLRKAIEILAPRATLAAPSDDEAGRELLHVIASLTQRGIDPERALEASLIAHASRSQSPNGEGSKAVEGGV